MVEVNSTFYEQIVAPESIYHDQEWILTFVHTDSKKSQATIDSLDKLAKELWDDPHIHFGWVDFDE